MALLRTCFSVFVTALVLLAAIVASERGRADVWDSRYSDPWESCAECHGLDGAGNNIKFPRLAGQRPDYIVKQLDDFRNGRRTNDGGQMQKTATQINEEDYPRVAEWFASQTPPWPKPTLDITPDIERARKLSFSGIAGRGACLSCHSKASLGMLDSAIVAPRIAGQHDFYIAKQLTEYRAGQRSANDPERIMTKIARKLSDADIASLAVYLSQNPALHDEVVP